MSKNGNNSTFSRIFKRITSFQKLFICITAAVIVYFLVEIENIDVLTHVMIGWDTFSLFMIIMTWITFFITSSIQIRDQCRVQDQSSSIIFMIVLISTLASVFAVIVLIVTKKNGDSGTSWRLPFAIAGMLFSWFLIHSTFTLRYAHIYYGDHATKKNTPAGGLDFPGDDNPDFLDFAYFSFVLGMTFQVSDVDITSKKIRKMALFHGLISFGFSTIMIGLTINLMAGSA